MYSRRDKLGRPRFKISLKWEMFMEAQDIQAGKCVLVGRRSQFSKFHTSNAKFLYWNRKGRKGS